MPLNCDDRGLDVNARHVVQRGPRRVKLLGDLAQPRAGAAQPLGQWREVAREQQVQRGAGVRDERVPGVFAIFLDVEKPVAQSHA